MKEDYHIIPYDFMDSQHKISCILVPESTFFRRFSISGVSPGC